MFSEPPSFAGFIFYPTSIDENLVTSVGRLAAQASQAVALLHWLRSSAYPRAQSVESGHSLAAEKGCLSVDRLIS